MEDWRNYKPNKIMEELSEQLEQIVKDNQTILNMEVIDYDFVNLVRKNMYDTALAYLTLKKKTVLIKRLSWKNASSEHIMQIIERGLVQLRYDLKSEVDVKLLKFISLD
jgi:guanylate kinase